jgi:uncharacterized phage-associated protein
MLKTVRPVILWMSKPKTRLSERPWSNIMTAPNTSSEIADYFLSQTDEEAGDLISNLKIQKLVYYAQGFHLALYGEPLFDDTIEAWAHGPVVPGLYHRFKDYGSSLIPRPTDIDFGKYSQQTIELLDEVYSVYGQYAPWKLRNMTHEESPWIEAFDEDNKVPNGNISTDTLRDYFRTLV